MRSSARRLIVVVLVLAATIASGEEIRIDPDILQPSEITGVVRTGYLVEASWAGAECRHISPELAAMMRETSSKAGILLRPFHNAGPRTHTTGLRIIMLGTPQLDGFPEAKEAFIRAAQAWEAMILTPIDVTLEADFGPTAFGTTFSSDSTIGVTLSSLFGVSYSTFRTRISGLSSSGREQQLYGLLAPASLPTDLGLATQLIAAGPVLDALAISSSDGEPFENPQIGFNSRFNFDTDRSDGITPGRIDFETVAIHEIGHALGFSSVVGRRELEASFPVLGTPLDLFRFRPGTIISTFGSATRILSSGGEHRFFAGVPEIALSTGRTDGTGGDGQQAAHWKAASITGTRLGVMDPQVAAGTTVNIGANDLLAFDSFGFVVVNSAAPAAPGDVRAEALSDTSVMVSWTDNSSNELGFRIYVAQSDGPFSRVSSTGPNQTSITLTGLLPGETFRFTVTAFNDLAESAFAEPATLTLPGTPSAIPAAPTELTVTPTSPTAVTLAWRDNSNNENGFNVYIAEGNGEFQLLGSTGPNATGGTISGLEAGAFLRLQVTAFNDAGESDPSNIVSINAPSTGRRRPARR